MGARRLVVAACAAFAIDRSARVRGGRADHRFGDQRGRDAARHRRRHAAAALAAGQRRPRASTQGSYRVVVATTAAKAAAGTGDVWDSGDGRRSARQTIDYAGPALASRTRYFWAVEDAPGSDWAPATWFETAYLTPAEWKGTWISGPARTLAPAHATPQASLDDACCLQGNTTLSQRRRRGRPDPARRPPSPASRPARRSRSRTRPADGRDRRHRARQHDHGRARRAAGDTNVKVASVTNFAAGAPLTIGTQTVTITDVGTAAGAATTLFAPAAAGDTNIKVTSVNGFVVGQPALIDGEIRTVTAVGTQGRATTLAAAAAAGDTNIKVASVDRLRRRRHAS